jgi:hypothetical protein
LKQHKRRQAPNPNINNSLAAAFYVSRQSSVESLAILPLGSILHPLKGINLPTENQEAVSRKESAFNDIFCLIPVRKSQN